MSEVLKNLKYVQIVQIAVIVLERQALSNDRYLGVCKFAVLCTSEQHSYIGRFDRLSAQLSST